MPLKKNTIFSLLTFIAVFISSCSSGNANQKSTKTTTDSSSVTATPAYDNSLVKGKVTDSVVCKNDNSQNYALYLPSYYTADKKFPCIYFFDAHARGALPVNTYKELAEKYGFVFIGSNVSKNGTTWEVTNTEVKALISDTRARINIDPQRIYTAGFSGGARVASSVAIADGGVAGVIGCSAGFPNMEQGVQSKFDYFGIVGAYDFNFTEMVKLDETLAQNNFTHQLLTFEGIHGWPSTNDFQTALLWMQVNAMKEKIQAQNDTLVLALKTDFDKRISIAKTSGDWIKTHDLLSGIARTLDGLTEVSTYKKELTALNESSNYKNAMALQNQLQQEEANQQQELAKEFTAHDEKWWTTKIIALNKNIHQDKTQESQMNRRLLNYLGLICYLNTNHALGIDDLSHAASYLKIFKQADPKNPDVCYLAAIYHIKSGNTQQAIADLNEATFLGYNDVGQLKTEPTFNSIHNDPGFKTILSKAAKNNTIK